MVDILVVKKDRMNEKVDAKIVKQMRNNYAPPTYKKSFNPKDFNDLARFFQDLKYLVDAPIEKAFEKFIKTNKGDYPFW